MLTITVLAACAGSPDSLRERQVADGIAAGGGLTSQIVSAGRFQLLTYGRGLGADARGTGDPVHVYVEGDGRPWRRHRPPRDPTPTDPLGLRLTARDPAPAALWVGRPCMYLSEEERKHCDPRWWTSHRYAPEVVEALDQAITHAIGDRPVLLVGHSGGGALATLLAARRSGVRLLLTVGAPLDLGFWVTEGRMTPLHGSLDPMDVAHRLADLPQRHLCGGRDRVVSTEVVQRFVSAVPLPNQAQLEIYPEHGHTCCWEQDWARMLSRDRID